jgi:hypothetical protein
MAWNIAITAENMTSMAEHAIPRSDIEMSRLLTRVHKRYALGLRRFQYMAACLAAETVQSHRHATVLATPRPW